MTAWLEFGFWTGLLVAVVVGMFESARRVVVRGPTKKTVLVLVGFAALSVGFGGAYYWFHLKSAELAAGLKENPHKELPPDWAADQPLQARHKSSLAYVSAAFLGHGMLLKHVDQSGAWVLFQPSQKEISEREAAVAVRVQLEQQSLGLARIAWTWWLGSLFGAAFGYLVGRENVATNNTAESDERKNSARGSP